MNQKKGYDKMRKVKVRLTFKFEEVVHLEVEDDATNKEIESMAMAESNEPEYVCWTDSDISEDD